ncbi:MAG: hypothetical protein WCO06_01495 [Candidatus Roizmanbacteria bacterium]
MSENIKMEDLVEKVVPTPETTEVEEEKVETEAEVETTVEVETEQDPLKTELERVQRVGRTEKEKAEFSLKKNAERVKELGGDPNTILGIEKETSEYNEDDDQPLTVGMYKKIQQESASKTALQLADEVQNETERELVKYHLNNSIKSTGNPNEDMKLARALVNAVKNSQIIEESTRKPKAKAYSGSGGVPAKDTEVKGELTEQEKLFLGKPFNMSKDAILKARGK